MNIIIENGQVVIELTELEFEAFETMFANLNDKHTVFVEGVDFPGNSIHNGAFSVNILPMHLCRTIGEACAVEQAGPLDIMSLYPFWKYGSARADSRLLPKTGQGSFGNIEGSIRKETLF